MSEQPGAPADGRSARPEPGGSDSSDPSTDGHPEPHPLRRVFRLIATVIFWYVMLLEVVLAIGFVFVLFGLDASTWFADLVYRTVERTMAPFRGVFTAIEYGTGSTEAVQPAIESSLVFAMIVYGIIALAAHDFAEWLGRPRRR